LATGFRDVDSDSDIGKLTTCLRFVDTLPSFQAYKKMSVERLRLKPGDRVVDIGCGLGFDVPRLADMVAPGGSSLGIDISEKLLNAAKRAFGHHEGVSFQQGDIHNLEIPANSVDAIRVDRTLQHVQDPQRVISEMVRVLKPGARLVCAEPDWSTFVIDAENDEMTDLVIQTWKSSFRNPHIGRQLLRRIRAEGIQNIWADGFILLADGVKAASKDPESYYNQGFHYFNTKRYTLAEAPLRKSVALGGDHRARRTYAHCLEKLGKLSASLKQWAELKKLRPHDGSVSSNYKRVLRKLGPTRSI